MGDSKGRGEGGGEPEGGIELEIKLVGAGLDPDGMLTDPAVLALQQGEVETLALRAVYFDTADFLLHRNQAVLRVRAENERFLVTAKTSGDPDGFARLEVEAPAPGLDPDRTLLLACLPPKLADEIGDAALLPVFRTEIERRKLLLETPAGKVELALDRGALLAGERSEPVAEAELELKSGDASAVWNLAQSLGEPLGLRPSLRSKGERGFALARNLSPQGSKAQAVPLPAGASLDGAVERILRAAFRHLLENQPAAEDGHDAEGLHQFRVALRRLRAFLKLLRGLGDNPRLEDLRAQAKTLMAPLNDARALDVLLAETLAQLRAALPDLAGLDALEERVRSARESAYERVRAQIADPGTSRFELGLGVWIEEKGWRGGSGEEALAWLDGPAEAFAVQATGKLYAAVLKRGRKFRRLSPPERHKVRIAIKNLRYAADFFSSALSRGKPFLSSLEALQDKLGAANDLAGVREAIGPLLDEGLSREGHAAGGAVLGWAAAKLEAEQAGLLEAWKGFKRKPLPWSDGG